jgi:predicted transposase YbfD/YdcC
VVASADFCGGLEPFKKDWKGLRAVVRIESWRAQSGKTSYEKRYAISSLEPDAEALGEMMRGHCSVENQDHWMQDVYFGEDASRNREGHGVMNFGILR